MDAFAVALIIFLGGSLITAWTVNMLGARLESKVQTLSHTWMQWPQRIMMYLGFISFFLFGFNYYYQQSFGRSIFELFENIPFLREISQSLRWFFDKVSQELGALFSFLPQEMPVLTIVFVLLALFVFLSLFNVRGLQRLIVLVVVGGILFLLIQNAPALEDQKQVNTPKKYERPAWATD